MNIEQTLLNDFESVQFNLELLSNSVLDEAKRLQCKQLFYECVGKARKYISSNYQQIEAEIKEVTKITNNPINNITTSDVHSLVNFILHTHSGCLSMIFLVH